MAISSKTNLLTPLISRTYCSSSEVLLVVRRRPHTVNGGGFVVTTCSQNGLKVVFQVDGCATLGRKGELILRDAAGHPIILIRQQALSIHKKWNGFNVSGGSQKLVFSTKEPTKAAACFFRNKVLKISMEPKSHRHGYDFEVQGYFPSRNCRILDSLGNTVAQVGVKEEIEKVMKKKDVYHVVIQPGIDQAFVLAVIAVLDYIYNESTVC